MVDSYYSYTRAEMLDFIPPQVTKVLEVGCGVGKFGALIKEKLNVKVWGIEPTQYGEMAKGKLDNVLIAKFEDCFPQLKKEKFDVIVFNDVLEHMEDPWKTLDLCKGILNRPGYIVASLPNFLYLHSFTNFVITKDFKYENGGIFDKTHLRFFTRKSIIRFFDESGFEIDKITGIHATDSKKMVIAKLLSFGFLSEMQFLQFGVRAKLR